MDDLSRAPNAPPCLAAQLAQHISDARGRLRLLAGPLSTEQRLELFETLDLLSEVESDLRTRLARERGQEDVRRPALNNLEIAAAMFPEHFAPAVIEHVRREAAGREDWRSPPGWAGRLLEVQRARLEEVETLRTGGPLLLGIVPEEA